MYSCNLILALTSVCLVGLAGLAPSFRPSIESCAKERAGEITLPYNETLKHVAHGLLVDGKYIPNPYHRGEKTECVAALHKSAEPNTAALFSAGYVAGRQLDETEKCATYTVSAGGQTFLTNSPNPTYLPANKLCSFPAIYGDFKMYDLTGKRYFCFGSAFNVKCSDMGYMTIHTELKRGNNCYVKCIESGKIVLPSGWST
jgi:hypothetical protein